jgi:hypothetical protein
MLLDQRQVRADPTRVEDSQPGVLESANDFARETALQRVGLEQHQCLLEWVHDFRPVSWRR